jgi:hypothetical protein
MFFGALARTVVTAHWPFAASSTRAKFVPHHTELANAASIAPRTKQGFLRLATDPYSPILTTYFHLFLYKNERDSHMYEWQRFSP